jgi:raffinose/stachyose/melibiose transport system permease protein
MSDIASPSRWPKRELVAHWPVAAVLRLFALTIAALVTVVPLMLLLSGSLMTGDDLNRGAIVPGQMQPVNYRDVWVGGAFFTYFLNSVLYAAVIVPITLLLSSMAAFAFARLKFRGRPLLFGLFLAVLMFPISVLIVPVFSVLNGLHLLDTRSGYMLAVLSGTLPLSTFILHRFFATIPLEMEEAAVLDGANIWTIFWRICLPLVRPGLAAAAVLTLVAVWNEFVLAVVVFRTQDLMPVQQGLLQFSSTERPDQQLMLAASALAIIPVIVFYVLAQKAITRGVMEGAVRG